MGRAPPGRRPLRDAAAAVLEEEADIGHTSNGEIVQWLLQQAESAIVAAMGTGTISVSALSSVAPSLPSHIAVVFDIVAAVPGQVDNDALARGEFGARGSAARPRSAARHLLMSMLSALMPMVRLSRFLLTDAFRGMGRIWAASSPYQAARPWEEPTRPMLHLGCASSGDGYRRDEAIGRAIGETIRFSFCQEVQS